MTDNRDPGGKPPRLLAVAGLVLVALLCVGAVLFAANNPIALPVAFAAVAVSATLLLIYGDR